MDRAATASAPPILKSADGVVVRDPIGVRDGWVIDGADAGPFTLVRHLITLWALAAPLHRHHREDEYTYVLSGRIGAVLADDETVTGPGDLGFKPRNQEQASWISRDKPAAVLEPISPAGLRSFFRWRGGPQEALTPEQLAETAVPDECEADPEGTQRVVERHGPSSEEHACERCSTGPSAAGLRWWRSRHRSRDRGRSGCG
jgi:mannose-6-phosphate isomerase-like protein (cupin superfamily)